MKTLYAVVIGRKGRHTRYITAHHLHSNAVSSEYPLAIYTKYKAARKAKNLILAEVGHKDVYVMRIKVQLN